MTPFGWEAFERDGGDWLRKTVNHCVAEFRVDGSQRTYTIIEKPTNVQLFGGVTAVSILRTCRVLEAALAVLAVRSTSEVPRQ